MRKHFLAEGQQTPPASCPNCGAVHNMAAAVDESARMPSPGDASICIKCGHLCVYDEHLDLRDPTGDEFVKIAGDERIVAALTALHRIRTEK